MKSILPLLALACAACTPSGEAQPEPAASTPVAAEPKSFATQVEAPAPDYAALVQAPRLQGEPYVSREATAAPPADARAIGTSWIERLEARHALLGYGLGGKSPDGPVAMIDVGMTETAFHSWARENGWPVPRHITWSFVPGLNLPAVSEVARDGIRVWPASLARTGAQNEALLAGRVELRDGCFWAVEGEGKADKLAFFHGEIGLDRDSEGFFVLKDRVGGQTLARLGEDMNWGGPPSAYIGDKAEAALRAACGDAAILVVGSPQSRERLYTTVPHLRQPRVNPTPPGG